ncbi:MAG: response regulator, partial [Desulfopila sp.]
MATLLYIEDNESIRQLVRFLLARRHDIQMIEASTGQNGLLQASASHPDIILVDNSLPDMTGSEVLQQLKAQHTTAAIPAIAISANPLGELRSTAPGFDAYLSKPLDMT